MIAKWQKPAVAAVVLLALFALPAQAQKTKLTIYTALENDQLAPFKSEIEKAVPEADVEWVRDSTGVITARFLAEKDNPKADIVMGLAASSLLLFKKAGLLQPYQPKGVEVLKPAFRSSDGSWVGQDAFLGVICFNTVMGRPHGGQIQGQARHASPRLVGNGLSDGCRMDPTDGRSRSLEVHGRAAPEHCGLHAFGQRTLRASGQGRTRRRHLFGHAGSAREDGGRPDRGHLAA
jgi:hypothetical protein